MENRFRKISDSVLDLYESAKNWINGRGFFPTWHAWNFKNNLAHYIVPRLKEFKRMFVEGQNAGIPKEFVGRKEDWIQNLDTIIFAFEYEIDTNIAKGISHNEIARKREKGLMLFAKYYDDLWD